MSYIARAIASIGVLTMLGATASLEDQSLKAIVDDLRNARTQEEKDAHASAIASRLDRLFLSVISTKNSLGTKRQQIDLIIEQEGRLRPRDITLVEFAGSGWLGIAYNIPLNPIGTSRRVDMRLWSSQNGTWNLSPLVDRTGNFAAVSDYPITEMRSIERGMRPYLLTVGDKGQGRGSQAFSLWDLLDSRCTWTRQLTYGDRAVIDSSGDEVTLRIEHQELTAVRVVTTYEITEVHVWRKEGLELLSTTSREVRLFKQEQPSPSP